MSLASAIALLRGINVGGHQKVPMTELRETCEALGWDGVRTYIQSGNVVFCAAAPPAELEAGLEEAIGRRFGFPVPVVVRTAEAWSAYLASDPFADATEREPSLVMLALCKQPPAPDAVEKLRERAADGERITAVGDALCIHFPAGSGRSRLTPALLDRLVGSPVTMRNWRTVRALEQLASAAE